MKMLHSLGNGSNKSSYVKFLFTLFTFLCFSFCKGAETPVWTLDTTVNGVDFYHSITVCNGKKVTLLKFKNRNDYRVTITWREIFVTMQIQEKKEGFRGKREAILPAGAELLASDCNDPSSKNLIILPIDISPAYEAVVEKFEFSEIVISRS